MKIRTRALALLLALALLSSLCACSNVRPVRSTAEEAETVMTVGEYSVPYELYRYLFLNQKRAVDNGDASFWDTADKEAYFAQFDAVAKEEILRIYSLFSLAEAEDIHPFGQVIDQMVKDDLKEIVSKDGSYADRKEYLAALRENFMNDSVSRLYLRYDNCEEGLSAAYLANGTLDVSENEACLYYDSENCAFVHWIYRPYSYEEYLINLYDGDREAARSAMLLELEDILSKAQKADDEEFINLTFQYFQDMYNNKELERGFVVGLYEYSAYYDGLSEACLALSEGETSGIVEAGDGYYIIRRYEKPYYYSLDEDGISQVVFSCRNDRFYRLLAQEAERLAATVEYSDFYKALSFDDIFMAD